MNWVAHRRGIRLVSRKLRSSCSAAASSCRGLSSSCIIRALPHAVAWIRQIRTCLLRALGCRRAGAASQGEGAPRAVAGQAPLAHGMRRMSRRHRSLIPFYEYDDDRLLPRRRSAGRGRGAPRGRASPGSRMLYRKRFAKTRALTAEAARQASPTCNSPRAIACRFSSAAWCGRISAAACSYKSSNGVTRHRSRRQQLLRPDRLLRRQCLRLRLLQGLHRRGRASRSASSGRCSAPIIRSIVDNVAAAEGDFRPRGSFVPHVRHRGGDAGGAARALSHAAHASRALVRRLSRLVGRRAAGHRQSDRRRATPTR